YYYKVKALDNNGFESAFSTAVTVTSYGLKAPTNLKAAISETKPKLTWTAAANATTYEIYRASAGTAYTLVGVTEELSFIDGDELAPLTKYYYKVRALDEYGFESALTAAVSVVSYGLKAPTNVKAAISSGMPKITWTAAANATEYRIYRAAPGGTYTLVGIVSGTSFIDNGELNPGTKYYYKVIAADNYGFESTFSAVVSAVTPK
ncbi:MAG: hypothetical protein IKZ82_00255, partial [Clostridia bacterium]|nr:hypothetical protein [Clostridia bacterium]